MLIGQVATKLVVSVHTLRYYEKIGLLRTIAKDTGGRRQYDQQDISRIRFIKRAQKMHFTLDEIKQLIEIDRTASHEKPFAQKLVKEKLNEVRISLKDLNQLKVDLSTMLNACENSSDDQACPIVDGIKGSV